MNNSVKIGIVVVAFGAAGFLLYNWFTAKNNDDTPNTTYWICANKQCKNEFSMPFEESKKLRIEQRYVPCPKCGGKETIDGFLCKSCKRICPPGGHGSPPDKCPYCKQTLVVSKKD